MKFQWRVLSASVIGTSHERSGLPCQDSNSWTVVKLPDGVEVLVAVVADGAGSAPRSHVGASLICKYFLSSLKDYLVRGNEVGDLSREYFESFVQNFRLELVRIAGIEGLRPRDYASTFLASVVAPESACFIQLGDGAIVVSEQDEPDQYCWVFWPQQGQYANETYFVTDFSVWERLEPVIVSRPINKIAMFTDGIQGLALHYESRTAYNPFFNPMFQRLGNTAIDDYLKLSISFQEYLKSDRINEQTDDDKTLLLACRVGNDSSS